MWRRAQPKPHQNSMTYAPVLARALKTAQANRKLALTRTKLESVQKQVEDCESEKRGFKALLDRTVEKCAALEKELKNTTDKLHASQKARSFALACGRAEIAMVSRFRRSQQLKRQQRKRGSSSRSTKRR